MRHLIRRPIGAGLDNDPDDIRIVRGTLKALKGDEVNPEKLSGFIDDDLDTDIRTFQQNTGLIEDGRLTPGGETERNLISRITGENIDFTAADDAVLNRSVGDGGENDPRDVIVVKRALGTLGRLKYDRTKPASPIIDANTVDALTGFQQDKKLLVDGRADPGGETIKSLREALEEKSQDASPDETQIALGPLLRLLLSRAARPLPPIIATDEAAKKAAEEEQKRRRDGSKDPEFTGQKSNGTKLEHIPPDPNKLGGGKTAFPPEDPDKSDGKMEGGPTEPVRNYPTVFPLPENPENLIQIFPGNTDRPEPPIIIERKGNEPTRVYNALLARMIERFGKKFGIKLIHIGGSRDADGNEIPETHLKNKETGGLKGGSFPDISFEIPGLISLRVYLNSADTYADGVTLTKREENAARRMEINMEDNAVLIAIPKLRANQTVDLEALEKMLEPIIKDLKDLAEGKVDIRAFSRRISLREKLPLK